MRPENEDIVRYRLERAEAAFDGARMFFDVGDYLQSTNRLYYACFYAVIAWLQVVGGDSSKHSGVRSRLNKDLVKTGRLSTQYGGIYNQLFSNRQDADYTDFAKVSPDDVRDWLPQVQEFMDRMKAIIEEDGGISLSE